MKSFATQLSIALCSLALLGSQAIADPVTLEMSYPFDNMPVSASFKIYQSDGSEGEVDLAMVGTGWISGTFLGFYNGKAHYMVNFDSSLLLPFATTLNVISYGPNGNQAVNFVIPNPIPPGGWLSPAVVCSSCYATEGTSNGLGYHGLHFDVEDREYFERMHSNTPATRASAIIQILTDIGFDWKVLCTSKCDNSGEICKPTGLLSMTTDDVDLSSNNSAYGLGHIKNRGYMQFKATACECF